MFDKPLAFKFVQRNRNKSGLNGYEFEYIYKFFVRNQHCRRKIIVEIRQYEENLFTVDFYATLASKEREVRNLNSSKYRYRTNVGNGHRIASTIFSILFEIRQKFPDMSFGFQAATMLDEDSDDANRRFGLYQKIMSFVTGAPNSIWTAFVYERNSYIFVIQSRHRERLPEILKGYGRIFGKTFT